MLIFTIPNNIKSKLSYCWNYFFPKKLLPVGNGPELKENIGRNVIFLHHSVGNNLIKEGNLKKMFAENGYYLWDHGYNSQGLVDPSGKSLNICFNIPSNKIFNLRGKGNTDPKGLFLLFNQSVNNPPNNAFSRLLQYDIIMFKSCYPNSAIKTDEQLNQYKKWFLEIRKIMDQHPNKTFIPFTLPPLHPLATNSEEANRARLWANWLKSPQFLEGHSNIFVFDLFGLLADSTTNMLCLEYQRSSEKSDSHPNMKANRITSGILIEFIKRTN